MKLCEHHIHPSSLILGLLGNHVTRYFGICAVVTFILLCFCPLTTLSSLSSSCSKSAGFTPADPWFVILSLFRLDPRQHSLKDKTSQNLSSFPHLPSSHLPLVSSYFWMSQIRPSESDIPNQTLEVYICSFESLIPFILLGPTFFCSLTLWDFCELLILSPFETFGSFFNPLKHLLEPAEPSQLLLNSSWTRLMLLTQ